MKLTSSESRDVKHAFERARKVSEALKYAEAIGRVNLLEKSKHLAFLLHEFNCYYNHTDGCSWGYEEDRSDPWLGDAHKRWLRIACKFVGCQFPPYIEKAERDDIEFMSNLDEEEEHEKTC